jgi:histidine triad (HIT) family protein
MLAEDCPFCHILQGRGAAQWVDEDEYSLAFLDTHPINPGHLLVIPKQHVPDFFAVEEPHYGALMRSVRRLAAVLAVVTQPQKVGVVIAGFDVPHTQVHLIPMHAYHDITSQAYWDPNRVAPTDTQQQEMAAKLQQEVRRQGQPSSEDVHARCQDQPLGPTSN